MHMVVKVCGLSLIYMWCIINVCVCSLESPNTPAERYHGQNNLDRETKRNTQLNKFSDFSRDSFNRQLDRLADDRDSDTYTSRVCSIL